LPVIPAGFAGVQVFYDLPGQGTDDAQVTFGLQAPTYNTAIANALDDIFKEHAEEVLVAECDILRTELTTGTGLHFISTNASVPGTVAQAMATPQVAYLLRKNTGVGGRKNTGRMYLPGVSEANTNGSGEVDAGMLNDLGVFQLNLLADMGAADMTMFILHSSALDDPTEVTSMTPQLLVATQRRRLNR